MGAEVKALADKVGKLLEAYERQAVEPALSLMRKGDFPLDTLGPAFMKTLHLSNELREMASRFRI